MTEKHVCLLLEGNKTTFIVSHRYFIIAADWKHVLPELLNSTSLSLAIALRPGGSLLQLSECQKFAMCFLLIVCGHTPFVPK